MWQGGRLVVAEFDAGQFRLVERKLAADCVGSYLVRDAGLSWEDAAQAVRARGPEAAELAAALAGSAGRFVVLPDGAAVVQARQLTGELDGIGVTAVGAAFCEPVLSDGGLDGRVTLRGVEFPNWSELRQ